MKVLSWSDLAARPYADTPVALTVGVFDGVHIGHRVVIGRVVGNGAGLVPVVVTFNENPQNVLLGAKRVKEILPLARKLSVMESLGVAVAVTIDFSLDFSKMSAKSFFIGLAEAFRIIKFVEGDNFHFGKGREAGRRTLQSLCRGIGAELETPERVMYKGTPVSSTRLRHAIRAGQLTDVVAMLAADYSVTVPAAANLPMNGGHTVVLKKEMTQVVPESGLFRCFVATDSSDREAVVAIDHDMMIVRDVPHGVREIIFKEKIS